MVEGNHEDANGLRAFMKNILHPRTRFAWAIVSVALLLACTAVRETPVAASTPGPARLSRQPRKTNSVAVIAEVLSLDEEDGMSALLRVRSILAYSQAFPGAIASGDSLRVKFHFKADSRPALTSDTTRARGLIVGDRIRAEIRATTEMVEESRARTGMTFEVYQYTLIEHRDEN